MNFVGSKRIRSFLPMHLVQSQTCLLWTHMISMALLTFFQFVPSVRMPALLLPPKSYYLTWSPDSVKIINNQREKCFQRFTTLIIRIVDLKWSRVINTIPCLLLPWLNKIYILIGQCDILIHVYIVMSSHVKHSHVSKYLTCL